jgi:hypothetical protein
VAPQILNGVYGGSKAFLSRATASFSETDLPWRSGEVCTPGEHRYVIKPSTVARSAEAAMIRLG